MESRRAEMLAAIEDASKIQNRVGQDGALARICYQWAGFDPRGAVENAIAWELEEVPGLFQNLALQWASADLSSAREWTELQPASEFRSELVARIGFAIAQDNPASAAEYVLRQIDDGPVRTEAAISVLHQWILKDPSAARSWAEGFPAGDLRDRALRELDGSMRYGMEHAR
jgi:hypothetical protein